MDWTQDDPTIRRLRTQACLLVAVFALGAFGYWWIEGWPYSDGLYMTAITVSTVGYGETGPLSPAGRSFTAILIFFCVVLMTCFSATLTSFIIEGDLSGRYIRRRMLKMISEMEGHVIVCGADQLAQVVVEQLMRKRNQVVVVDDREDQLKKMKRRFRRLQYVVGKGTCEVALAEANVLSASSIVAAMESDVDNLLITIACKDIGTDISVIARANDAAIANSIRKARVDELISPNVICGNRMAEAVWERTDAATQKLAGA